MTTGFSQQDMLLMHYAAGKLSPPEALVIAAHVALNAHARRRVAEFEALGAHMMCTEKPTPLSSACLDAVMARIEALGARQENLVEQPPIPCPSSPDIQVPAPVFALIDAFCARKKGCWSKVTQGMSKMELRMPCQNGERRHLRLVRLAPEQFTPRHAHHGREITLVLDGGFHDETGHYTAGDIVIIDDPRLVHQPTADPTGCLCLMLTSFPLRFTAPLQRFLNAFWRI